MKLALTVKEVEERIVDTEAGQKTHYRLSLEGDGRAVRLLGPEPFEGFTPGADVAVEIRHAAHEG